MAPVHESIARPVWEAVAAELRAHRHNGLGPLLTEDTVRFASARALVDAGVAPAALRAEWPHPALRGSRIDLVVDDHPPVVIEFKFPREPNEKNAAWTMALGEVLKDFYRLAAFPGVAKRLFVYVETARLRRYMTGAARRYGMTIEGERISLRPADTAKLPTTAAQIIGAELAAHHVQAWRDVLIEVDGELRMAVYEVDPLGAPPGPASASLAADDASGDPMPGLVQPHAMSAGSREGVRQEILMAIHALLTRSGGATFTPAQVLSEMKDRGTRYADTTIRTMVTGHMCRNAPDNAARTYDDLERVDRGLYRLIP